MISNLIIEAKFGDDCVDSWDIKRGELGNFVSHRSNNSQVHESI